MNETPITTYYAAYHYVELYEEYLQIHQSTGAIPYPEVIKIDGEKFFFIDIKSLTFFKEIEIVGEEAYEDDAHEEVFSCKIKMQKQKGLKIKSLISWEGRFPENKTDEYRLFINELLNRTKEFQPKIYKSKGMMSRLDNAIPFFKVGGISITGLSVFTVAFSSMMDLGDFTSIFFDSYFIGITIPIVLGSIGLSFKLYFSKKRQESTNLEIENTFLPLLSFNPSTDED